MKDTRWKVHLPNYMHILDFDFEEPIDERDFRAYLRDWLHLTRLQAGTEVWAEKNYGRA